jgi:hypothetical protein
VKGGGSGGNAFLGPVEDEKKIKAFNRQDREAESEFS